eukprot:3430299-Rhodomonas_salina.5
MRCRLPSCNFQGRMPGKCLHPVPCVRGCRCKWTRQAWHRCCWDTVGIPCCESHSQRFPRDTNHMRHFRSHPCTVPSRILSTALRLALRIPHGTRSLGSMEYQAATTYAQGTGDKRSDLAHPDRIPAGTASMRQSHFGL